MIPGMSLEVYTTLHVALSLAGIGSGLLVMYGLVHGQRLDTRTVIFLGTTAATSVTGFGFPANRILPSHIVGFISMAVLGTAWVARYRYHLAGGWRPIYAVSAVAALYLNVFVAVVQMFQKVPPLQALAPTQTEGPFLLIQLLVLLGFVALGIAAVVRFRDVPSTFVRA